LGQHVGGMVMTQGPLCELVPIENAAMEGRTVIEWDKDDLDELGILKVDVLSLGMLTAIRKSFELIEKHTGQALTLATVPKEDPAVYDMMGKADTMGVFQIESRAQMSMLPRLKPREFYDLVIEVAIVRPGPIQGNMVHPYLRRRAGEEPVTFPSDAVRQVLEKTLGVPLFQEQAMRLAIVAAGFTPGEADQLRRAMGSWRRNGVIEQFRQKLIVGMTDRGLPSEFAERVFLQIRGFGEYGFPESHAASFALLVYVSAWLKCYHMAAFTAALINSQPMGFYAPAQLVRNARDHGVEICGVDVNASEWDCTLETEGTGDREQGTARALRLGFRVINGISAVYADLIVQARQSGAFRSWEDFLHRTRLSRMVLVKLAEGDVFNSLGLSRRQAMWHALAQDKRSQILPLFAHSDTDEATPAALPRMSMPEQVIADYQAVGMSLRAHPISFHRARLDELGVLPANRLPRIHDGRIVRVAGLVLVRQRPGTAKGITFVTLEDETGVSNLVVRQDVWNRFHRVARTATAIIAHGRLQNKEGVIHVLVTRLEDLSELLMGLSSQSRDFR
jgi:error-prone DNA polymerase